MSDSMLGSIATKSGNKKAEQTTLKMIDASASEVGNKPIFSITKNLVAPLFPRRLVKARKEKTEQDIFENLWKVEVNTPLLDAIKQIIRYAKFLKEMCTNKKKLNIDEKIRVKKNVFVVIQRKLPQKCKDLGMFTIDKCKIYICFYSF
jgi:hypothetical protein